MSGERAPKHDSGDREFGLHLVTPGWVTVKQDAVHFTRTIRGADQLCKAELIVPAAQHPLVDGVRPGPEFEHRLQAGLKQYQALTQETGRSAKFFVTGSRHHDKASGQTDSVALYDAAGLWLLEHDVPANAIHGKDWMSELDTEIYSGADEIRVAAYGFKNNREFQNATYWCSPGQRSRAEQYALAYELPAHVAVPEALANGYSGEQFHGGVQHLVLQGLTRTIDPYGALLAKMTRDRVPQDGNPNTVPELIGNYTDLQWHLPPAK
jgi:hypothetical protein